MRIPRIAIFAIMLGIATAHCYGTEPDGVWGKYSYRSSDLKLEFTWDENGIHDALINGRKVGVVRSGLQENRDNFGSDGVWPFDIVFEESERHVKRLDVLLLFDRSRLMRVAGLYSESEFDSKQILGVKYSKVIEMRHKKLSWQ